MLPSRESPQQSPMPGLAGRVRCSALVVLGVVRVQHPIRGAEAIGGMQRLMPVRIEQMRAADLLDRGLLEGRHLFLGLIPLISEPFRALHRRISPGPANIPQIGPNHSFDARDARYLTPGEYSEIAFDLLPISWLFKPGHRLRVAIALADRVVVFTARPGTIKSIVPVELPRPRDHRDPVLRELRDQLIELLADEVDRAFAEQEQINDKDKIRA